MLEPSEITRNVSEDDTVSTVPNTPEIVGAASSDATPQDHPTNVAYFATLYDEVLIYEVKLESLVDSEDVRDATYFLKTPTPKKVNKTRRLY